MSAVELAKFTVSMPSPESWYSVESPSIASTRENSVFTGEKRIQIMTASSHKRTPWGAPKQEATQINGVTSSIANPL
jgi:hypothetical protein